MSLEEAILACLEGHFVTHQSFTSNQSMHAFKRKLYYEDGANLSDSSFNLYEEAWAQNGWSIKKQKENIDLEKLKAMHTASRGYMLQTGSYEDCFKA